MRHAVARQLLNLLPQHALNRVRHLGDAHPKAHHHAHRDVRRTVLLQRDDDAVIPRTLAQNVEHPVHQTLVLEPDHAIHAQRELAHDQTQHVVRYLNDTALVLLHHARRHHLVRRWRHIRRQRVLRQGLLLQFLLFHRSKTSFVALPPGRKGRPDAAHGRHR